MTSSHQQNNFFPPANHQRNTRMFQLFCPSKVTCPPPLPLGSYIIDRTWQDTNLLIPLYILSVCFCRFYGPRLWRDIVGLDRFFALPIKKEYFHTGFIGNHFWQGSLDPKLGGQESWIKGAKTSEGVFPQLNLQARSCLPSTASWRCLRLWS